jgi:hypothetical protein
MKDRPRYGEHFSNDDQLFPSLFFTQEYPFANEQPSKKGSKKLSSTQGGKVHGNTSTWCIAYTV